MAQLSPLRRRMIEDMTVRNLSPATQRSYLNAVSKFSRYFGRSPDHLGLEDVHAFAYIDWPIYEKIRAVIRDNRAEYMRIKTRGAPRNGELLLHGIAWCARCGHKMYVRYKGGGEYVCNHLRTQEGQPTCQHIRAAHIDADNRLVASELERRWEVALNDVRAAEEALARQTPPKAITQVAISKELNDKVISLTGRLPQIWGDETISDAHRKALLRCLIEKVVLDRGEHDLALARIVWRGGAMTELEVKMSVNSVTRLTRGTEMRERLLALARDGVPDDKIAAILTHEGHRSPHCADKVLPITVGRLRRAAAIKVANQRNRWEHDDALLSPPELARKLKIPVNWLYVQIRSKRLLIDRQPSGAYLFPNTPSLLDAVRELRNHVIAQLDLRICQPNKEGHQHG